MAKSAAASRTTKRAKEEIGKRAVAAASKKRKQPSKSTGANSDEEDAGFTFTRPSKMAKTAAAPQPTRSSPRNHADTSSRPSGQHTTAATPRLPSARKGAPNIKSAKKQALDLDEGTNGSDSFVALPVSDTPIIRKNQALRQGAVDNSGRRRSSLSMRGKRASSMGNGFSSQPHPDVTPAEFYKHIGVEMPDPIRMKQLLGWCARRALEESKATTQSQHSDAALVDKIARIIEEDVIRDLADGKITTSWYGRPQEEDEEASSNSSTAQTSRRKLPHPQNIANAKKLAEMEARLAKLQLEEEAWRRLRQRGPGESTDEPPATASTATESAERFAKLPSQQSSNSTANIDLDLLSAAEAEFVHAATTRPVQSSTSMPGDDREDWLRQAEQELEFNVDAFRHHLHSRAQFIKDADEQATQLLAIAAEALVRQETRERTEQDGRGVGTMDILRAITRSS